MRRRWPGQRRAGLVCLGKTNMTEFAFSGLGINPTFGTPANPADPETPRVPGGSSSGSGVAVARGLAPIAVGSDTGGSIRIPSAWNGLVGLKPGWGQVPSTGTLPLAPSLDTFGPLARTASDANLLYAVLAGTRPADLTGVNLSGLRLAVADTVVWEDAEDAVMAATEAAISRLGQGRSAH